MASARILCKRLNSVGSINQFTELGFFVDGIFTGLICGNGSLQDIGQHAYLPEKSRYTATLCIPIQAHMSTMLAVHPTVFHVD